MTNKDALTKALEAMQEAHDTIEATSHGPAIEGDLRWKLSHAIEALSAIPADATQAPVEESEHDQIACSSCGLTMRESELLASLTASQDAQERDKRVFTYKEQPGNIEAWRFGEACSNTIKEPAGDYIDTGLQLLLELQNKGYGIVELTTAQPSDNPEDQFCDANCTWRDHHPDCVRADKPEGKAEQAVRDEVPPPCDSEIHQNGAVVAVMNCGMLAMEGLVKEANRTEPGMDWHYFGGRAVVKTLGDASKARAALERAMPKFLDAPAATQSPSQEKGQP